MNKLDSFVSFIAKYFVMILFSIIVIGMLIVNSVYLYVDTPAFRLNGVGNYLGILGSAIILGLVILLHYIFCKKLPNFKWLNLILIVLYVIAQIAYIKLIPMNPFSDSADIYKIAFSNFTEDMEYLQRCNNNLPITIILNLIFRITTYNLIALKVFNILCVITTFYFMYKICSLENKKTNIVLLGVFHLSTFLYTNQIYNDTICIAIIAIVLYLHIKLNPSLWDKILVPVLLWLQYILRPVGIIVIIASIMYYILKKRIWKMVLAIVSVFIVLSLLYNVVESKMIPPSDVNKPYPIWSYIQMGINEPEFGFQDGSHSANWTAKDVTDRIKELGPERLTKLLAKKEYWLWTEGTYQSERYAFGIGWKEHFDYDTILTKQVYDYENSTFRNTLDYLMKGEYLLIMFFALMDIVIKDDNLEKKNARDLFLYIIVGFFCFYLIWEIKSRYIYCLYPIFLILSSSGLDKVINKVKQRKEVHQNGKV